MRVQFRRDSIAVLEGDRQHAAIYPEDLACTVLGFRGDAADRTAKLRPDAARPRVVREGIRTDRDARFSLAAIGRAIESAIATNPTTLQHPEVRRSLDASLLETAHGLLSPADDVPPRATRDEARVSASSSGQTSTCARTRHGRSTRRNSAPRSARPQRGCNRPSAGPSAAARTAT